ncbi:hypothetical protein SHANETTE_154 [Bacillus phage Shanette]|jgi:DNA-binding protein|uniref:Uncharacterized protein n=3 Tax=Siminovitchvirus TaxID=1918721 RepID=S5MMA2_9CAUD|nr:hypothetical protein OZ73_gp080 [Bacillus phage CP-51]YP_009215929.1 hypothetical protein AVV47_gp143 [Bacillus phage JL]YP_009216149.1 hypothetical protein AVV46_gp143 [Bacillus phage Shanette]AGR46825.1 hypothetical protein JL_153 [Bacillus phage JL]AGR47048.1 hypothetical protein SHANETTE_154 [Bacillus phage Shanette]AID50515.1 hypothetical protein [Bacillus phage CP-51]
MEKKPVSNKVLYVVGAGLVTAGMVTIKVLTWSVNKAVEVLLEVQ